MTLDIISDKAYINGEDLQLSQKEFSVLLLLVKNEGQILSVENIYGNVWGQPMANDKNAVQRAVSRLRKKIEANSDYVIRSEYSRGYVFEKDLKPNMDNLNSI